MGLLWMAALAKAAQKASGTHHHRYRTSESKRTSESNYSSKSVSKPVVTYDYYDFVRAELTDENSLLRSFFQKIVDECKKNREAYVSKLTAQKEVWVKEERDCYLPIEKLCQELKASGINITSVTSLFQDGYFNVESNGILLFQFNADYIDLEELQETVDSWYKSELAHKAILEKELDELKKVVKNLKIRRALAIKKKLL